MRVKKLSCIGILEKSSTKALLLETTKSTLHGQQANNCNLSLRLRKKSN
jgi:hypothetical protein